jgi:hypothetical protein
MAMVRREEAAKRDPADHCRKNKPKLRVNSSIDSHVILPWPPLSVKFQPLRKLPQTRLLRCRRQGNRIGAGLARSAIMVNTAAAGEWKD